MADDKEFEKALQLEVRKRIYDVIIASPGLHFREIQRRTDLAVGSLQYHLEYLRKHHIIRLQTEGKFVRYYSVRESPTGGNTSIETGQQNMAFLRHDSTRKIVLYLLNVTRANNEAIAGHIGLSPSTTSWHLEKMVSAGVLKRERVGRKSFFTLLHPNTAQELLVNYKKSFLDAAVDNFVEMVEELAPDNESIFSREEKKETAPLEKDQHY